MANGPSRRRRGTVAGRQPGPDPDCPLTAVSAVVYDWDLATDRIRWGVNAAAVFGAETSASWVTGTAFSTLLVPGSGPSRAELVHAVPVGTDGGSGTPYTTRYTLAVRPGLPVAVEDAGRVFAGADGRPAFARGLLRVVPALPADGGTLQARLRSEFLGRFAVDLAEAAAGGVRLTVFAMAVGNLAALNETLGLEAADEAVAEALRRLRGTMRNRDRFECAAANRFVLVLRGCGRDDVPVAAERLRCLVEGETAATGAGPAALTLAIGAAPAVPGCDAATLLRRAEESLEIAKRRGSAPFVLYEPSTRRPSRARRADPALEALELLNGRRIVLARQPVVEAGSRRVAFHEALLRVEGPDGRVRPAADVVPALERAGLVTLADIRMLELVAAELGADPALQLSVNASPRSLESDDWLACLQAQLGARPGTADRLIVEVTETGAVPDPDLTRRRLEAVKGLGVRIAIDDFGAGHTSFRHLRTFPVDLLKLDGLFVQNLARQPRDGHFVRTLVDLAAHLGVQTVAEWVEDEPSAVLLQSWGVDFLQGDHLGRPVVAAALPANAVTAAA